LSLCEAEACEQRKVNGFLAALFHDLPEVLTRDITSPIKGAIEGLDEIIKDYERIQMEEKLLPLLPAAWHQELSYYTDAEFTNRIRCENQPAQPISFADMCSKYNDARYFPIDGEVIRCCDHLAAFVEASISIRHGITSRHLQEGVERLMNIYQNKTLGSINYGLVFQAFAPDGKQE